ncbi:MAG: acyl-CoA dehydrogenase family protein [Pseudomonadota bacterium]
MNSYRPPLEDMSFLIDEVLDAESALGKLERFQGLEVGPSLTAALLGEAAKLAQNCLDPLRRVGDKQPATCRDGAVTITPGYAEALAAMAAGGWMGIAADPDYGGQGLPELYGTAVMEMWNGADMALALQPMLSAGAALTIRAHGSRKQKQTYLEKMHTGQWAGTMNLTESGAGSDLGVMKSRAVPEGDHFLITGQKIFITWGDHDATENIIHLVLAKLPDAPSGSAGISLFIVPKLLVKEDGSLGARNDVYPVSVEHKLGIHGSPTCVMSFGDNGGAVGYLVGQKNQGLAAMFTMMNEARLKVGLQGLGAAEGAFQQARAYSRDRVQGGVPIIQHADVKRMLLTMRSLLEAGRAMAFAESMTMDLAYNGSVEQRAAEQARLDLMIPVIKAWLTETAEEIASLGIQIHGGMGYVEETGAAQYYRDIRIAPIYEGTNGIQAADLIGRKLCRNGGSAMAALLEKVRSTVEGLKEAGLPQMQPMGVALERALVEMQATTATVLAHYEVERPRAMGASFDYLMQTGYLFGAWHLLRSALVAAERIESGSDKRFYEEKIATAAFYVEQILPRTRSYAGAILNRGGCLADYPVDWI